MCVQLPLLVALVPADALDVIPCRVLVAGIALADLCVRLASNLRANPEMRRAMARWALMALRTRDSFSLGRGVVES